MAFLFANNAKSTLSAPMSAVSTTANLATGTGALFPNPTGGDVFTLTLNDAATGQVTEIMYCTARVGDVCTVIRGQEGTAAQNWTAGDFANLFVTAGQMGALAQSLGGTTAQRPTVPRLYQTYFDSTLLQPIWCSQVSPPIWLNAAGVAV